MKQRDDRARAVLGGDAELPDALASGLLKPERDNLVERPWGGDSIRTFKRVEAKSAGDTRVFGEAFEISAFAGDDEARRFPSRLRLDDGSLIELPELLEQHGKALLGEAFIARHGACFPLLPKTLAVKELLSVQGHPAGHTEVYVIIDAEPGATLRLGFRHDVDAAELGRALHDGLARQRALLALFADPVDAAGLQARVAPWFADRDEHVDAMRSWLGGRLRAGASPAAAAAMLSELKTLYWRMLDAMNEIEVEAGQVIYNATPPRLLGAGVPSAEVHALGNPEGREILALEIRRPGPTFRAWDNVRFPCRDVDVDRALGALNLRATERADFVCERREVPGHPGVTVSVDCEYFRVEHLEPAAGQPVAVAASGPHSLHCVAGAVDVIDAAGRLAGRLESGESALVPLGVGAYTVALRASAALHAGDKAAEVVRVSLPPA